MVTRTNEHATTVSVYTNMIGNRGFESSIS